MSGSSGNGRLKAVDLIKEVLQGARSTTDLSVAADLHPATVRDWMGAFESAGLVIQHDGKWHWGRRPNTRHDIQGNDAVALVCCHCQEDLVCRACGAPNQGAFFRPRGG
jgi:hypothetical protein